MKPQKIRGAFWTGETGRAITALPNALEVRVLATYLISSPFADYYGLYQLDAAVASIHTGIGSKAIDEAFTALAELDFAHYLSGWVWVVEMAGQQLGALKPTDYMTKNARRWYGALPNCPFLGPFWDRYAEDLVLEADGCTRRDYVQRRGSGLAPGRPIQGASKPRSDLKEDQDLDLLGVRTARATPRSKAPSREALEFFEQFWKIYPRRTHKKQARDAIMKLALTEVLKERILSAVHQQTDTIWASAPDEKIPHAATWLNNQRWEDEVETGRPVLSRKTASIARAVRQFADTPSPVDPPSAPQIGQGESAKLVRDVRRHHGATENK